MKEREKEQDPGDFESDFSDGVVTAQPGTPVQKGTGDEKEDREKKDGMTGEKKEGGAREQKESPAGAELPQDVRIKLRKLEKMEAKYTGTLHGSDNRRR